MNLSVKNMVFAFVAGVVIFSLLMTAICVAMFNSEIDVARSDTVGALQSSENFCADEILLFTTDKSDGGLNFAVLAMVDKSEKSIFLTPIYGDYLIPYKNALSYVSSVYSEMGNKMFPEAIKAFSGLAIRENDIIRLDGVVNLEGFKSILIPKLSSILGEDFSDFKTTDFALVLRDKQTQNTHEHIRQIDTDKSVEKFRAVLG